MPKMPSRGRSNLAYLIIAALIFGAIYMSFFSGTDTIRSQQVEISTIQTAYGSGDVKRVSIDENKVVAELKDGRKLVAFKAPAETAKDLGFDKPDQIPLEYKDASGNKFWTEILLSVIPFLLIVGFLVLMMRSVAGANKTAMSFGTSNARTYDRGKAKVTFADMAGAESAKQELVEVVDFLKNPKKYLKMGAKIPKGVLLVGPPGTGKTLLARAVAGEASVPFFSISGSEFVEMFVGVGASRVRDLFKKARKNAPCIIFVDEIDAVGRHRGAGLGGGHDEREQTLNQILSEMDGFETGTNVIVIAATNRPDVLDPALLRPGRFDRRVTVDMPDIKERLEILKVHARNKPLAKEVDMDKVARHTPGFAGADLENLLNESAILAARHNKTKIVQSDLQDSLEKVIMGPERKSRVLSDKDRKITAFHEVGHALVGYLLPNCDPVHKISIVSRGQALGVTWFLPERDEVLRSKSKFLDEIASLLGGYAAEMIVFDEMTTGASSDLDRASKMARAMVTRYGMGVMGPVVFGEHHGNVFLGKDLVHERNYSEATAKLIDDEVHKIISEQLKVAVSLLNKHRKKLDEVSAELLEKEVIDDAGIERLFNDLRQVSK
jgi:cell division protease FtsH